MKHRITRVPPLQVAKVLGVLYVVLGIVIFMPLVWIISMTTPESNPLGVGFGMGFMLILPVIYGCIGFIATLIGAALYNFVAGFVGGIEVELEGQTVA